MGTLSALLRTFFNLKVMTCKIQMSCERVFNKIPVEEGRVGHDLEPRLS